MEYLEACKTLGVKSETPAAEVKIIYRRLAQAHHPDKGGNVEQFKKITLAYRTFVAKRPFIRILRKKQEEAETKAHKTKDPGAEEQNYSNQTAAAWRREMDKAAEKESVQYQENRIALMITLIFFLLLMLAWGNRILVWLLIFAVLTCLFLAFSKDNVAYYVVITGNFIKSFLDSIKVLIMCAIIALIISELVTLLYGYSLLPGLLNFFSSTLGSLKNFLFGWVPFVS